MIKNHSIELKENSKKLKDNTEGHSSNIESDSIELTLIFSKTWYLIATDDEKSFNWTERNFRKNNQLQIMNNSVIKLNINIPQFRKVMKEMILPKSNQSSKPNSINPEI
jgi:hypothetical protein